MTPLDWQRPAWKRVHDQVAQGRLPHALLIAGGPEYGATAFSLALARGLLCDRPQASGENCGVCPSCALLQGGTHPDLFTIGLEDEAKQVRIDQIRRLSTALSLTRHRSRHRVAVVDPADDMSSGAANSLLKTLEEPPTGVVIVLVAAIPSRVAATLRSRCQTLDLRRIDPDAVAAWLGREAGVSPDLARSSLWAAGNRPMAALEMCREEGYRSRRADLLRDLVGLAREPARWLATVDRWESGDAQGVLRDLESLIGDLCRARVGVESGLLRNRDLAQPLLELAEALDWRSLFRVADSVREGERLVGSGTPLRPRDLLDEIALRWCRAAATGFRGTP